MLEYHNYGLKILRGMSPDNPERAAVQAQVDAVNAYLAAAQLAQGEQSVSTIKKFPDGAREKLVNHNWPIYSLGGQSVLTLRDQGLPIWMSPLTDTPEVRSLISTPREAAFDPKHPFLIDSGDRTYAEHLAMIDRYARDIERMFPGATAILAPIPDYLDLAYAHLKATKQVGMPEYILRGCYTSTTTHIGSRVGLVGYFNGDGIFVNYWAPDDPHSYVRVFPLVVAA